jgi:hypothetical protein
MSLFSPRKDLPVRSFVLKLVNTHCPALTAMLEGPRVDRRVNLVVAVLVVPVEGPQIQIDQAFTAVTKDFSNTGVSIVLDRAEKIVHAIFGFQLEGQMTFLRAELKHLDPMGGGFYQLGFSLAEIVTTSEHPELAWLSL